MRPLRESPLCQKCKQLARGRLTEIRRLDHQPWVEHVRRWWLVNDPGAPQDNGSSLLGIEILRCLNEIMQEVTSEKLLMDKPYCTIDGPVSPILHHRKSSPPNSTECRLCNRRVFKIGKFAESYADECDRCIVLIKEKQPLPGARLIKILFVYLDQDLSYAGREAIYLDIFDGEKLCFPDLKLCGSNPVKMRSETIANIKLRLDECAYGQEHEDCRRSLSAESGGEVQPPSRLVRIEEVDGVIWVRLLERGQFPKDTGPIQYATLSYRWGDVGETWKLTEERYAQSCSGVTIDLLPLTFRDAIRVTMSLALSYIWIDALCIVQDCPADWAQEAPRMAAIYSQSAITIAATCSPNVNAGIFLQQYRLSRGTIHIAWTGADMPQGFWGIDGYRHWDKQLVLPLSSRGWVFQELLLSPRIIHFGRDQIWMQCRACVWSETKTARMHEVYKAFSNQPTGVSRLAFAYERLCAKDWVVLVRAFTHCELTQLTDRLVAFSGVAEAYSIKHGLPPDSYKAGIWESDAVNHLLWRASRKHSERQRIMPKTAPTWSWASLHARTYHLWSKHQYRTTFVNPNFSIVGIATNLDSSSPFGPVKGGYLDVRVLVHPMVIYYADDNDPRSLVLRIGDQDLPNISYPHDNIAKKPKHEEAFTIYFDEYTVAQRPKPLCAYLIPVHRIWESQVTSMYNDIIECLVICGTGREGEYERAGLCRVGSATRFAEMPEWWNRGSSIAEGMFLAKHDDGAYTVRII